MPTPSPGDPAYEAACNLILADRRIAARDELPLQHYLGVPASKIETLEPLRSCTALRHLRLFCPRLPDIDPLCDLPELEGLVISSKSVGDLSGLARLPKLRSLWVTKAAFRALEGLSLPLHRLAVHCKVESLEPLAGMEELRDLRLGAEFAKLPASRLPALPRLERLKINLRLASLEPLAHLTTLRYLDHSMSRKEFRSLAGIEAMRRLTILRIDQTAVDDLEPLRGLSLEELGFAGTKVRSIDPLLGMTTLKRVNPSDAVGADRGARAQLSSLIGRDLGDPAARCGPLADFWPEPLIRPL